MAYTRPASAAQSGSAVSQPLCTCSHGQDHTMVSHDMNQLLHTSSSAMQTALLDGHSCF